MSHMKFKTTIGYLGKTNSILPKQMADQLPVEVYVINRTEQYTAAVHSTHGQSPLFGLDNITTINNNYSITECRVSLLLLIYTIYLILQTVT